MNERHVSTPRLETPEEMADRLARERAGVAIRADHEQIAAWCETMAGEAERKAGDPGEASGHYRDGEAAAYRAVAALLKGAT